MKLSLNVRRNIKMMGHIFTEISIKTNHMFCTLTAYKPLNVVAGKRRHNTYKDRSHLFCSVYNIVKNSIFR